jgi:tetratricopeptide (TPR) repeat protein
VQQRAVPLEIVGREAEQAALAVFVERVGAGPAALLYTGAAGIGKTTIWRAGQAAAEQRGLRVLVARGAEAEATLPFAGLIALLDPVADTVLPSLSEPQSSALAVAMRRAAPSHVEPDPLSVSLATMAAVRMLAQDRGLVLAIDDLQWIDASSRRVLEFVMRRLTSERIGGLITLRTDSGDSVRPLISSLPETSVHQLEVGPLPLIALERIMRERLGVELGRPTLVRIERASNGNPFFALELGRALLRRGIDHDAETLPVPKDIADLLRQRLASLSPVAADALLTAAALAAPTHARIITTLGGNEAASDGLDEAMRAGVLERSGESIRFAHPLLASVAYLDATDEKRCQVHRRIAAHSTDAEERARHMALGSQRASERVALALEDAAAAARTRGSPEAAAELAELALRRTPAGKPDRARRRGIAAAKYWMEAGDAEHARSTLEKLVPLAAHGPARAEILIVLADTYRGLDWEANTRLLNEAAEQAGEGLTRVAAEHRLARAAYMTSSDLLAGREHARHALQLAERVDDPSALAASQIQLAWLDWVIDGVVRHDLLDRAAGLHAQIPSALFESLINAKGLILLFSGEVDQARAHLRHTHKQAERRGDWNALAHALLELVTVETVAGNWQLALDLAYEAEAAAHLIAHRLLEAAVLIRKANVLAHFGRADEARRAGEEGLALSRQVGALDEEGVALEVLGFLDLSLGDPEAAHARLGAVLDQHRATGRHASFSADDIEALVMLGRVEEAERDLAQFERLAHERGHAWWIAQSARCRGLILGASGDHAAARIGCTWQEGTLDALLPPGRAVRTPAEGWTKWLMHGTSSP